MVPHLRVVSVARALQCTNVMNGTSASDSADDDLVERWFEQGEMGTLAEAAPYEPPRERRSRAGVVIAAISATVLTLVIVFAGHV